MNNSDRMLALLEQMAALIKDGQEQPITEAPERASLSPTPNRLKHAANRREPTVLADSQQRPVVDDPPASKYTASPIDADPDLATYEQIAEEYGVGYSYAAAWARKCPDAVVRDGRNVRLRRSVIRDWRQDVPDQGPHSKKKAAKPTARDLDRLAARTADIVSQISRPALRRDGHDQWPMPRNEEPIIVYGEEIWPTNDARYDWKAAYYAFNIWRTLDKALHQTSPTDRGHLFRNPLGPMLCHLNGPAGIVLQKIGNAMIDCPHAAHDTRGPGKVLQGR